MPVEDPEVGIVPEEPIKLQKRQTGDKEVPKTLYAEDVAKLVWRLEDRDKRDMEKVKKFSGFTENAYRYIFAYEDKFPEIEPELKTVLPSGKRENDKKLKPEPERGLIAYTYSQKMVDKKIAQIYRAQGCPFVFEKNGEPYVMQTWPTRFNEKFKKEYTLHKYPNNPDPEHFKVEALEDFKSVMLTLFPRSGDKDLPLWLGVRQSENKLPMYEGTGSQLMAFLRLRHDVREDLRITKILEPDGFLSKFTAGNDENKTEGEKPFHMDLALPYCLYTKQGWETMACVKPLDQFDWEATRYSGQEIPPKPASDDGVISLPLEMEWVSGPAYVWARQATAAVWGGAAVTITFAFLFYKRADWWDLGPLSDFWQHLANTVTAVIIVTAILFGLYADDQAMSYCIVPWLQTVENSCRIPLYGQASCNLFRYFSLACTVSQMLTIQLNAWVLADTLRNSTCKTEEAWNWLWKVGTFKGAPLNLLHSVILLWGLSTLQLILPGLTAVIVSPKGANKGGMKGMLPDVYKPIDTRSYKFHCGSLLSGGHADGVTLMALASGMRYTGSVSISYPLAKINRIKNEQIGFMIKQEDGKWEQSPHGWRFRCVRELEKVYEVQLKRLWFILVFKYAGQMNVQVTLWVLKGTIQNKGLNYFAAGGQLLSLGAMMLGIASELFDLRKLLTTFWDVRSCVCDCLKKKDEEDKRNKEEAEKKKKEGGEQNKDGNEQKVGSRQDLLARHFFKIGDDNHEEEPLTYADLNRHYYRILRPTVFVVLVTLFAMWLIGYQMLKFMNFFICPDHVWSWNTGCLAKDDLMEYMDEHCPVKQ